MARPHRTQTLRRLHTERATWNVPELTAWLTAARDPLALAAIVEREWKDAAALVPLDAVREDTAGRIAAGFFELPRDARSVTWMEREARLAVAEALASDPITWRAVATEPTPFERAVAACFGVDDALGADLIRLHHSQPLEDRRAVHALLPLARLGAKLVDNSPTQRSRRRAVAEGRRGLELLRRLVAATLAARS